MDDKYVVYFSGGTLKGVFGAGFATALQDKNFYPHIRAIHAASAGTMTGAYFLARQTAYGATIYWEDLPGHFIRKKDFFIGVWQRFKSKFIKHVPHEELRDALDIDYAMNIVKVKKHLDVEKIIAQDIPLYIKLLDLDACRVRYVDARRQDIYDILEMGISVFPYVHKIKNIDGKRYIDGGIVESIGIEELLTRYPENKILVVVNWNPYTALGHRIKCFLEGLFMQWMFGDPRLYTLHAQAQKRLYEDLRKIAQNPRVTLVRPGKTKMYQYTDDPKSLKEMYNSGYAAGINMLEKLTLSQESDYKISTPLEKAFIYGV